MIKHTIALKIQPMDCRRIEPFIAASRILPPPGIATFKPFAVLLPSDCRRLLPALAFFCSAPSSGTATSPMCDSRRSPPPAQVMLLLLLKRLPSPALIPPRAIAVTPSGLFAALVGLPPLQPSMPTAPGLEGLPYCSLGWGLTGVLITLGLKNPEPPLLCATLGLNTPVPPLQADAPILGLNMLDEPGPCSPRAVKVPLGTPAALGGIENAAGGSCCCLSSSSCLCS